MVEPQRIDNNGGHITPYCYALAIAKLATGIEAHMQHSLAMKIRDKDQFVFSFENVPIVESLRVPVDEIHLREIKSGALLGKIVHIGPASMIGPFE